MMKFPRRKCIVLALLVTAIISTVFLLHTPSYLYIFQINIHAYYPSPVLVKSGRRDVCSFPEVDPFSPTALKYYEKFRTISCEGKQPTITYFDGSVVGVDSTKKVQHYGDRNIQCWYRGLEYQRKVNFKTGPWQGPFQTNISMEGNFEYVEAVCRDNDEAASVVSKMYHYATNQSRAWNYDEKQKTLPKTNTHILYEPFSNESATHTRGMNNDDFVNVLMVGIDSLSSNLFKRSMPKTRSFMTQTLNAVEMSMYNKVGDNTFPNLLAITAGVYESDMPWWNQNRGFDQVPFIWDEFKAAGYYTQYVSDRHDFDDFSTKPTDSYNLPMVKALMQGKQPFNNNCFGDQVEIKLWLDLIIRFVQEVRFNQGKFFSLAMFKRPTHHFPNQASAVDEFYHGFLQELWHGGLLENTFLVLFGDHGPRTGKYRETYEGSIEERAPNMIIYVPEWFRNKHHTDYNNLLTNARRLTTNFDIHKTLQSLIPPTISAKHRQAVSRGISLFADIPDSRTCGDASISPHFCLCYGGIIETNPTTISSMGQELVHHINSIIRNHDHHLRCAPLTLRSVINSVHLGSKYQEYDIFRVVITTDPGGAEFEATIAYKVRFLFFSSMKVLGMVSRINTYRYQSDCVADDSVLRMYCYCKNLLHADKTADLATQIINM